MEPTPTALHGARRDLDLARQLAAAHGWREKVCCYVTRRPGELLVLEHVDAPEAGIQVPAGGVDPGETPMAAACRELFEETGLRLDGPRHLGSYEWDASAPSRIRHFYRFAAPLGTPDSWLHVVTAGEGDAGLLFRLTFRHRDRVELLPGHGFDDALPDLAAVSDNGTMFAN